MSRPAIATRAPPSRVSAVTAHTAMLKSRAKQQSESSEERIAALVKEAEKQRVTIKTLVSSYTGKLAEVKALEARNDEMYRKYKALTECNVALQHQIEELREERDAARREAAARSMCAYDYDSRRQELFTDESLTEDGETPVAELHSPDYAIDAEASPLSVGEESAATEASFFSCVDMAE